MIIERAYAKLNLALQVVRKRNDGFHDLKMIMVPLELHDTLTFEKSDSDEVISNVTISDNIILKAVAIFKESLQIKSCVKITLDKKIPIGAGLGGGSADAAATIRGLNRLFEVNKEINMLEDIVLKLGSDTLFCLYNEPSYVYGRGEYLETINYPPHSEVVLFCPPIQVSTKKVFMNYPKNTESYDFNSLLTFYQNNDWSNFWANTRNDLMITSLECYPKLNEFYQRLQSINNNVYMTGSGAVFYQIGHNISDVIEKKIKISIIRTFFKEKSGFI